MVERKFTRMGRRRFIRTLVGLGVPAAAAAEIPRSAAADLIDDPEKEVPLVKAYQHTNHDEVVNNGAKPNREPVLFKLSRAQWRRIFSAYDARHRIDGQIRKQFGRRLDVGVTTDSGTDEKIVQVEVPTDRGIEFSTEDVRNALPTLIDGVAGRGTKQAVRVADIPVTVIETSPTLNSYFDSNYRPVPGGCNVDTEADRGSTLGTPAYDDVNGREAVVKDFHTFDFTTGQDAIWQPDYTTAEQDSPHAELVRKHKTDSPTFDAAVLDPNTFSVEYDLADYNGGYLNKPISGIVTEDYLKYLEDQGSNGEKLELQGRTSGRLEGYVQKVNARDFAIGPESEDGDSGGPVTLQANQQSYIAGIHWGNENSWGWQTMMEEIEKELSVTV